MTSEGKCLGKAGLAQSEVEKKMEGKQDGDGKRPPTEKC